MSQHAGLAGGVGLEMGDRMRFGYCERLDGSFWAEPFNAATNAAFLAAALVAFWLWRRQGVRDRRVLALILITRGGWKLVKTVTAFTVSHSITLSLATLGYVHVPQRPVEAAIALSIVFVAAEILRGRQGRVGLTARAPWIVALTFGLMHGLGFAGGLSEAGLPDGHIPTALLFFSIGVETGHFLFIGAVCALMAVLHRAISRLAPVHQGRLAFFQILPPYAIGGVAMFWVIERLAAF